MFLQEGLQHPWTAASLDHSIPGPQHLLDRSISWTMALGHDLQLQIEKQGCRDAAGQQTKPCLLLHPSSLERHYEKYLHMNYYNLLQIIAIVEASVLNLAAQEFYG